MIRCDYCAALAEYLAPECPVCGMAGMLLECEAPAAELGPPLAQDAAALAGARPRLYKSGIAPWDKALGGFAVGSSIVVYGSAGTRKSTWCAAVADGFASARGGRALYLSAEMPTNYVAMCVRRVRKPRALSIVGSEVGAAQLDACLSEVLRLRPAMVVYDSIQAFDAGSPAGTAAAILQTIRSARRFAATMGHVAVLVSQVNQDGQPNGPYRSIHDCDVVVHVCAEELRVKKNRFVPVRESTPLSLLQPVSK